MSGRCTTYLLTWKLPGNGAWFGEVGTSSPLFQDTQVRLPLLLSFSRTQSSVYIHLPANLAPGTYLRKLRIHGPEQIVANGHHLPELRPAEGEGCLLLRHRPLFLHRKARTTSALPKVTAIQSPIRLHT